MLQTTLQRYRVKEREAGKKKIIAKFFRIVKFR